MRWFLVGFVLLFVLLPVSVFAQIGQELLPNPSFDTNADNWYLYDSVNSTVSGSRDTVDYDSSPAGYRIECTESGSNPDDIKFDTRYISITQGKCYRLTFRAKSTSQFTIPRIRLKQAVAPYASYYATMTSSDLTVTTDWGTEEVIYHASVTASDTRITMHMGSALPDGATLHMDTFSLKECGECALGGGECCSQTCSQPQCSDGTPYGQCSSSQPLYCDGTGSLIDDCNLCGCPSGFDCQTSTGSCQAQGTSYYVSLTGLDSNPGTFSQPFRTIERARNEIRTTGEDGVTVYIRGGVYEISNTIQFDNRDSGAAGTPNVYQGYPGEEVRIVGGIRLDPSDFSLVTSGSTPDVWSRIDDSARGHVMQIDLSAYTTDYGTLFKREGLGPSDIAALELFFNQEAMELARWPNRVEPRDIDKVIHNVTVVGEGINPDVTGFYDYAGEHNNAPYYKLQGQEWYMWKHLNNNQYYITDTVGGGQGTNEYHWVSSHSYDPRGGYSVDYGPATGSPVGLLEIPGFETIYSTSDDTHFEYLGTRPERWVNAEDVWIYGHFPRWGRDAHIRAASINTNTKVITLESEPSYGGIIRGQGYYTENLLEEIDIPGEWYLNRNTGILYFWPPGDNINGEIYVSIMEDELVHLDSVNYMTFKDITFEIARAILVLIEYGSHCTLEGCVIRNVGDDGVVIDRGYNHGLERCEVYETGENGIFMRGGDRVTLTPANHYVRNSEIHDYGRWITAHRGGIMIWYDSIGHEVSHNHIHDGSAGVLYYRGNDHLIEYNDIHNVLEWCSDYGAIYTWPRDWGARGTIIRYNFVHHIHSPAQGITSNGIYLDGSASGQTVYGNILYDIEGFGIKANGGRDNFMENNVIVKCGYGLEATSRPFRDFNCDPNDPDYDDDWDLLRILNSKLGVDYQSPPWSTMYPRLAAIPNDCNQLEDSHWLYPEGCIFSRNIGWQTKYHWMHEKNFGGTGTFNKYEEIADNIEYQNPLFVDEANLNMTLRPNSPAFTIPGFQDIPFDQIGIISAASAVPGDIDGDDDVDLFDLSEVTSRFGLMNGEPGWDSKADLIVDGEIDIYDLVFVASRFT